MSGSCSDVSAVRRLALIGPSAVGLAACVLVAGCGSSGESGAAKSQSSAAGGTTGAEDRGPHDWRDSTYRMTCDGLVPGGFSATLGNGAARVPAEAGETPYYEYFDVRYEAEASGDVDGDGVPDTVVLLQCSPQPSNGFVEEAQVFSGARGRLGVLPSPSTLPEASMLAPLYDPGRLTVDHGDILAGMRAYGPGDSHASGPSQPITVRWHWDGRRFVRIR